MNGIKIIPENNTGTSMFQTALEELRDHPYKSQSHTFNRAVIASYNNVEKYGIIIHSDFLLVKQQRKVSLFLLSNNLDDIPKNQKFAVSSEKKLDNSKVTKEVCYDLQDFFDAPGKKTRRLIRFKDRPQVSWEDTANISVCMDVYNRWTKAKTDDPKVFQISFNPARYKRTYGLKTAGFNIYQKLIKINNTPYAVINYAIDGDRAYELSFCSCFFDKELKLINDQNEAIMIASLHDLYEQGIKTVNLGTDAGIKGLKFFKKQFPFSIYEVYGKIVECVES